MGKKQSLLERLDDALTIASSETEKDTIYLRLYETGNKVSEYNMEEFYKIINEETLLPPQEHHANYNKREIRAGKELATKLRNAIILPEKGSKHYGSKYERARRKEYKLLENFYQTGDKNGKNIQS